ncbi:hypothetical protein TPHA_0C04110 [Tetrapisispora phaffii CBS 4417]|uniref:Uncharacterized protein n=1 Tax=Tetrapisispora phaffii (strain ATCC 24235 / CBS 4417 / NBRC 1672 / NRRL Y-8282 / UCD 70-5) TaxID=1071381 RepID=G8BQP9_TETPH|nr:hypothetical protein TPHA_0C04110 [Tetrapisispora phaffii CBS 4417]CCE62561.1 hypothetical protein TPHA_0C04110 [Tetrapisispora phaffii CBS 4417]
MEFCLLQNFNKNVGKCKFCITVDKNHFNDIDNCECIKYLNNIYSFHCHKTGSNPERTINTFNDLDDHESDDGGNELSYMIFNDIFENNVVYRKPLIFELKSYIHEYLKFMEKSYEKMYKFENYHYSSSIPTPFTKIYETIKHPLTSYQAITILTNITFPLIKTIETTLNLTSTDCTLINSYCYTTIPTTLWSTILSTSLKTETYDKIKCFKFYTTIDDTITSTYTKTFYNYYYDTTTETEVEENTILKYKNQMSTIIETNIEDVYTTVFVGKKTITDFNKIVVYTTETSTDILKNTNTNILTVTKTIGGPVVTKTTTMTSTTTDIDVKKTVTTETTTKIKKKKLVTVSTKWKSRTITQYSTTLTTTTLTI